MEVETLEDGNLARVAVRLGNQGGRGEVLSVRCGDDRYKADVTATLDSNREKPVLLTQACVYQGSITLPPGGRLTLEMLITVVQGPPTTTLSLLSLRPPAPPSPVFPEFPKFRSHSSLSIVFPLYLRQKSV